VKRLRIDSALIQGMKRKLMPKGETRSGGRVEDYPDGHWRAIRHGPPLTFLEIARVVAARGRRL
jgi:hypothetical protein